MSGVLSTASTKYVTPINTNALTTQLTTITSNGSSTADYALQAITNSSPYGFASADEGETLIEVVINLQTRLAELETILDALGILA